MIESIGIMLIYFMIFGAIGLIAWIVSICVPKIVDYIGWLIRWYTE